MSFVSYTSKHSAIVKSGIEAISKVFSGKNMSEKESLLLCLDKFLDPYYGYSLPNKDEIVVLLQNLIVNENSRDVKEDALNLLTSYCWPPFPILEDGLGKIEPELLPDVRYAINMNNEI